MLEQILRFAKNNKIDMIVMGSQRLKGISKIKALGSVTRKVSESADCPVRNSSLDVKRPV